jgi:hypothetical protein
MDDGDDIGRGGEVNLKGPGIQTVIEGNNAAEWEAVLVPANEREVEVAPSHSIGCEPWWGSNFA